MLPACLIASIRPLVVTFLQAAGVLVVGTPQSFCWCSFDLSNRLTSGTLRRLNPSTKSRAWTTFSLGNLLGGIRESPA